MAAIIIHRALTPLTTWSRSQMGRLLWAILTITTGIRHPWRLEGSVRPLITNSLSWIRIYRRREEAMGQITSWAVRSARCFSIRSWRRWIRACYPVVYTRMRPYPLLMGCSLWHQRRMERRERTTIWTSQSNTLEMVFLIPHLDPDHNWVAPKIRLKIW
jgi:hypothetical protein